MISRRLKREREREKIKKKKNLVCKLSENNLCCVVWCCLFGLQIGREALACRHGAALFDLTYYGKTYLCGPEAREAAAYLCSANTNFPEGKTVYTCLLNADAGIEGDVTVTSIGVGSGGPIDPLFKVITPLGLSPRNYRMRI